MYSMRTKNIKFGRGKNSKVELIPQPSDDPNDPLNWPRWRKDLNVVSLLMMVGLIGGMKTAFVTTNGAMTADFRVSYTAVAALTAVPLMLSSFTGTLCLIASKVVGKRPLYLGSFFLIFIGSIWNMTAHDSYGSCMGARVFQGLGWGAFDTLVIGSIQDTYFVSTPQTPSYTPR
jgi:MFS family permease